MVLEELTRVVPALTDPIAAKAEPRTTLFHKIVLNRQIDQVAFARDTLAVQNVELRFAKRRRNLVFDHLYPGAVSDHAVTVFNCGNPADIEPHRGVKL